MLRISFLAMLSWLAVPSPPFPVAVNGNPTSDRAGTDPDAVAPLPHLPAKKVMAVVESSLATGHNQIRQFAFDNDPSTYFESEKNPTQADHLTLVLAEPVTVESILVLTGKPDGKDLLKNASLEVSSDGKTFVKVAAFENGSATAQLNQKAIKAIRIQPGEEMTYPLVVREIAIDSKPAVAVFRYPVEFIVDSDAPDMKEWVIKASQICERQYAMICDELMSPGFKPLTVIRLNLKNDYKGVAAAGGGRITGSVSYFKSHPDDIGAMVHETTHCVQMYRGRGNPGWLVEGIADYIRFFKYEPGKLGRLDPDRVNYDNSYRVTAAFLGFVVDKYQPLLVNKLNALMREGKYKEEAWKELTGKTLEELNQDWRRSLAR